MRSYLFYFFFNALERISGRYSKTLRFDLIARITGQGFAWLRISDLELPKCQGCVL